MELSTQFQREAREKSTNREVEVKGALIPGSRGARAFAEYMGLRPEPVVNRTSAYLGPRCPGNQISRHGHYLGSIGGPGSHVDWFTQ